MNVPNTYSLCTFIVFSGYLLTTDTEKRPDIYQCSYLAFKLNDSTEKCPVQNLNKAKKPSFDDISLGKTKQSHNDKKVLVHAPPISFFEMGLEK